MRYLFLAVVLAAPPLALAQETNARWSFWFSAVNATWTDQYGIEHDRTDFSYRYRLSTPCQNKNCSIDLQLRNNSDRAESVNYIISVEQESGHTVLIKDHRNFAPNEIQDIPVDPYGQSVTRVKIE
jgi:hypothetical protein